ncbi:carbon-nitrogen hydrolase family protein [Algoriphagus aquimarinus]|uniref:carbon-nitrogen hydrolase family protein n=1 Tax=Algoriphagus aquimarinus TaxID=237018 RepID=UPI0030D9CC64|tara:strand:+ start:88296 stop:89423 length:1128 start_codon:yes stop_codon:yes gene_type:complete
MIRKLITLFLLTIFIWLIWSSSGRNTPLPEPINHISLVEEVNSSDSFSRNIIGIQPLMDVSDYFIETTFKDKIRQYLVAATRKSFIQKNSIIVYPESIGTWLFLLGEKHNIIQKNTFLEARNTLVYSNSFDYMLGYIKTSDEEDKQLSAIFRMKAKSMLSAYYDTFSALSKETNTYIVAGSIVLPDPKVVDGEIYVELGGPLYNASFIFGPDGLVIGNPILKAFLNTSEARYTSAGNPQDLQVFDLPFGKTAVMLGTDNMYSESYQNLIKSEAEILLSPAFCYSDKKMSEKISSLDSLGTLTHANNASNSAKPERYEVNKLQSLIENTSVQVAVGVSMFGELWDLNNPNPPIVIFKGESLPLTPSDQGAVFSFNF